MGILGLMKIGSTYFIKIDEDLYPLVGIVCLENAFAYLVAYHFVLHSNYAPGCKFVFGFLERLFRMKGTVHSQGIKDLEKAIQP